MYLNDHQLTYMYCRICLTQHKPNINILKSSVKPYYSHIETMQDSCEFHLPHARLDTSTLKEAKQEEIIFIVNSKKVD